MAALTALTHDQHQGILEAYDQGTQREIICARFHISHTRLTKILTNANVFIRNKGPRKLSPQQEREVVILWETGSSMVQIAKQFLCSLEPIKRILAEARSLQRLTRRNNGDLMVQAKADEEKMIADYHNGLSTYALHKKYGHHYTYIRSMLRKSGIDMRDDRTRQGPDSPLYTGGRYVNNTGYVLVWIPKDSPFASMRISRGMVLEHRYVMAQHIGRSLFRYETVHHRNGNKEDNRIENLELWERSHGEGQRAEENPVPHCPTCRCKS